MLGWGLGTHGGCWYSQKKENMPTRPWGGGTKRGNGGECANEKDALSSVGGFWGVKARRSGLRDRVDVVGRKEGVGEMGRREGAERKRMGASRTGSAPPSSSARTEMWFQHWQSTMSPVCSTRAAVLGR